MADEAPKIVHRSQRRKKEKYSDHARPRIKFRAGQLKKIAELEAKLKDPAQIRLTLPYFDLGRTMIMSRNGCTRNTSSYPMTAVFADSH
jgi:hypothetical protein